MAKVIAPALALLLAVAVCGYDEDAVPVDWSVHLIRSYGAVPASAALDSLKRESDAIFELNANLPFPCYGGADLVPVDSVVDVPLFVGERMRPCYPCAPRTVLRRYAEPGAGGPAFGGLEEARRLAEMEDLYAREAKLAALISGFVSYERGYAVSDDRDELECRARRGGKREIDVRVEVRLSENGRTRDVGYPPRAESCAWTAGGWSGIGEGKGWSGRTLTRFESLLDRIVLPEWTFPDHLANAEVMFLFIDEDVSNAVWRVEIVSSLRAAAEPEYCAARKERARELRKRWLEIGRSRSRH